MSCLTQLAPIHETLTTERPKAITIESKSRGLPCPDCGGYLEVIDSRMSHRYGEGVRRRRKCRGCGMRVTTLEVILCLPRK